MSLHCFCRGLVCALRREKKSRLIAASGASFSSGKNNGVLTLNVIYRKESQEKKISPHERDGIRALTFGHTFAVLIDV